MIGDLVAVVWFDVAAYKLRAIAIQTPLIIAARFKQRLFFSRRLRRSSMRVDGRRRGCRPSLVVVKRRARLAASRRTSDARAGRQRLAFTLSPSPLGPRDRGASTIGDDERARALRLVERLFAAMTIEIVRGKPRTRARPLSTPARSDDVDADTRRECKTTKINANLRVLTPIVGEAPLTEKRRHASR